MELNKEKLGNKIASISATKYEKAKNIDISASVNEVIELVADLLVRISLLAKAPMDKIQNKLMVAIAKSAIETILEKEEEEEK